MKSHEVWAAVWCTLAALVVVGVIVVDGALAQRERSYRPRLAWRPARRTKDGRPETPGEMPPGTDPLPMEPVASDLDVTGLARAVGVLDDETPTEVLGVVDAVVATQPGEPDRPAWVDEPAGEHEPVPTPPLGEPALYDPYETVRLGQWDIHVGCLRARRDGARPCRHCAPVLVGGTRPEPPVWEQR